MSKKAEVIPSKKGGTTGRRSPNDDVLLERRKEETKLYGRGRGISEIARKFGLDWRTVRDDIAEYQKLLRHLEDNGVDKDKISLAEVRDIAIKSALSTANAAGRAGLLGKAIEASKEIAILRGIRGPDGQVNINNQMVTNQGAENAYDKLSDRELKAEFDRRRTLVSSVGNKKSKKKL